MKTFITLAKLAFGAVAFCLPRPVPAYMETLGGVEWSYALADGTATVTGAEPAEGDLAIPSTLGGYPVTAIGTNAFYNCTGLTNMVIPNGVTKIGGSAFSKCTGLKSVTVPDSMASIGDWAFSGCSGLNAVRFSDLAAWCGISFGGPDANPLSYAHHFYLDGGEVTNLTIPDSVTSIGNHAFYGGTGLEAITLPDGITNIGNCAFCGCSGLASVVIPDGVASIGEWAFSSCTGLTNVVIPRNVTDIKRWAFAYGSRLEAIDVDSANAHYKSENGVLLSKDGRILVGFPGGKAGEYRIPDGVTGILDGAFQGCRRLTSVEIPDSVTTIGCQAFLDCYMLHSVSMGNGVKSIAANAFRDCSNLASLTIPDNVSYIGSYAFDDCSALKRLYVPASWEGVPKWTDMLANAGVPEGCAVVYGKRKETVDGVEWLYSVSDGQATIESGEDWMPAIPRETVGAIAIPPMLGGCPVTGIGDYAFFECTGLTDVAIPDSITKIGCRAFVECGNLTNVTIPDGVTSIEEGAFAGCSGLTDANIPDGTRRIGAYAFQLCSGLTDVKIPDNVTDIGTGAFEYCSGLTNVTIGKGVASIGDEAFGSTGLASVTIPDNVTNIGWHAFSFCTGLKTVAIGNGVTGIGDYAFFGCASLVAATIPDNVVQIGSNAFTGCSDSLFDDAAIPGVRLVDGWAVAFRHPPAGDLELVGVRGIADSLFAGCTGLTRVSLGNGVTGIGTDAFSGCTGLESAEIPASVAHVGSGAFSESGLKTLFVPASWKGTTMLAEAGVPAACNVVYVSATGQTLSWAPLGTGFVPGDRVALSATASGGGKVLFEVLSGPGVVEGNLLVFTGSGTVAVRASQPGDVHWLPVEETREVPVAALSEGRRVYADLVANYPDGWTDGSNGGSGFGPWRFDFRNGDGTGWAGCGIWNPSANGFAGTWEGKGRAFGLIGKGSGYAILASRSFKRALGVGDAFALEMAVNWDSNMSGAKKGFALTAGEDDIVVVNHGAYPGNISVNGKTAYDAINVYGLHPMAWTFTVVDGTTLRFTATGRDDPANVCTGTIKVVTSAIDGFRLQSVEQYAFDETQEAGDCRQSYYDNFRLFLQETAPVEVPQAWLEANAPAILAANGNDCELAALATASNGCNAVWECYVAGLDPENAEEEFTACLAIVGGKPVVSSDPQDENTRNYTVYGKKSLTDRTEVWTDVTANPNVAAEGYRFFRVGVSLKPE